MPTSNDDMIALSFVMFTKHVNLGGETSKHLGSFGAAGHLDLHPSGMVRVTKPSGVFWVGATCIESAEQRQSLTPAIELTEKADVAEALSATGAQKAEILREKAGKTARGGKSANSEPTMSRADEILAELSGK